MHICLVGAPTLPEFGDLAVQPELRRTLEDAPLGILSLAAVLEPLGIETRIVAANQLYYEYLDSGRRQWNDIDFCGFMAAQLASSPAAIFGFSTICSSYPLTVRMAAELRRRRPDATIIFGGPQASVVDQETLRAFPWIDIVVRGEAEETMPRLLADLPDEDLLRQVPGITFRAQGEVIRNPDGPLILDLDRLPLPAYHLYLEPLSSNSVPLELGRGCPFSCTFCSTNDFFRRRFRLKSSQHILEQMCVLHERYGVTRFELVHDMFTVDRKRVVEFCETLLASGRNFRWSCSARTDCVDEPLLRLMAQAGCTGIFFGIETGAPRLQKIIDKSLDLDQSVRVFEQCHRLGIETTASLITGFPEETYDDLRGTANFLLKVLRYDDVTGALHLLAPLAKTPIQARYRDSLFLEDAQSEICKLGWEQNPLEQELVRSHPDIFPNFYHLPTQIDRRYFEEFRAFYLTARSQFRWLLLALHQRHGDIVTVFDNWRACLKRDTRAVSGEMALRYYLSKDFIFDFLAFVRSSHHEGLEQDTDVLAMLGLEQKWRRKADDISEMFDNSGDIVPRISERIVTLESIPALSMGTRLVPITSEEAAVLQRLRGEVRCDRCPPAGEFLCVHSSDGASIEKSILPPLSCELLRHCDGVATLASICDRQALEGPAFPAGLGDLSSAQICIHGIVMLAEKGLVTFSRGSSAAEQPSQPTEIEVRAAG
jgi:radical SAM superfamily enzyme YgiQ (UPF0313 family)